MSDVGIVGSIYMPRTDTGTTDARRLYTRKAYLVKCLPERSPKFSHFRAVGNVKSPTRLKEGIKTNLVADYTADRQT